MGRVITGVDSVVYYGGRSVRRRCGMLVGKESLQGVIVIVVMPGAPISRIASLSFQAGKIFCTLSHHSSDLRFSNIKPFVDQPFQKEGIPFEYSGDENYYSVGWDRLGLIGAGISDG
jgi:hypothetical protein